MGIGKPEATPMAVLRAAAERAGWRQRGEGQQRRRSREGWVGVAKAVATRLKVVQYRGVAAAGPRAMSFILIPVLSTSVRLGALSQDRVANGRRAGTVE